MDLTPFCNPHDAFRDFLHKPMRYRGHLYASDRKIAARIEDDPSIDAGTMPSHVRAYLNDAYATAHAKPRTWRPLPTIDKATIKQCSYCNGTGRVIECRECKGDGEIVHDGAICDCRACGGYGDMAAPSADHPGMECPICIGSGSDPNHAIDIDGVLIAQRYVSLIAAIPGAEISTNPDPIGPQAWRAPGVLGVVMPIDPRRA